MSKGFLVVVSFAAVNPVIISRHTFEEATKERKTTLANYAGASVAIYEIRANVDGSFTPFEIGGAIR